MKHYEAYGISIASDIDLPDFEEFSGVDRREPDLRIRVGRAALKLGRSGYFFPKEDAGLTIFACPGIAVFQVRAGQEIIVRPYPGAEVAEVTKLLLNSALAPIFHQRGILALEGSCVSIDGSAIAFLGGQDQGRSTLTTFCCEQGAQVLSEGIVAISKSTDGQPIANRGCGTLKFRQGGSGTTVKSGGGLPDRAPIDPSDSRAKAGHVLIAVCVLAEDTGAGDRLLEKLSGAVALDSLIAHTWQSESLEATLQRPAHFRALVELERSVEMWRLRYAGDIARGTDSARMIVERHRRRVASPEVS